MSHGESIPHELIAPIRSALLVAGAWLLLATPAGAWQTTRFASNCEDDETRDLIEEAHAHLHDHVDDVWAELDRPGAAVHGYGVIPDTLRASFASELDRLKFTCDHSLCDVEGAVSGISQYVGVGSGGVVLPTSGVVLCVDQIEERHAASGIDSELGLLAAAVGLGAAYLAQGEVGAEAQAKAETLSNAIHNMILTPDLSVDIVSVTVDHGSLHVAVDVENENRHGAGPGDRSLSEATPNGSCTLTLNLNGTGAGSYEIPALEPREPERIDLFVAPGDGFDPLLEEQLIEVEVDSDDRYFEQDETNNIDSVTFTPWVDLAITHFELMEPYETVVVDDTGTGGVVPGGMRRIRFEGLLENLSSSNAAGFFVLERTVPEHQGRGRFGSQVSRTGFSSLQPQLWFESQLTAEVPVELDGASYTVRLHADVDEDVLDPDRSNNVHELVIDEGWFRPDYTVVLDAVDVLEGGDLLVSGRVRNIGPEPGGRATLRLENWDGRVLTQSVRPLPVLAEHPFQFEALRADAPVVMVPGTTYDLAVEVDGLDNVDENDEDNNRALVSFRYGVDLSDLQDILRQEFAYEDLFPLDVTFAPWAEHELGGWPQGLEPGPWLEPSASGPFLPPVEILIGETALGSVLVVTRQWHGAPTVVRSWGRANVPGFQAQRIDFGGEARALRSGPGRGARRRGPPR